MFNLLAADDDAFSPSTWANFCKAEGAKHIGIEILYPWIEQDVSTFDTSTRTLGLSLILLKASLFSLNVSSSPAPE